MISCDRSYLTGATNYPTAIDYRLSRIPRDLSVISSIPPTDKMQLADLFITTGPFADAVGTLGNLSVLDASPRLSRFPLYRSTILHVIHK